MVIEAQIAEKIGVAEPGLSNMIADVVKRIGLPVQIPAGLDRQAIYRAIQFDKKRAGRRVRFALPVRIGEAKIGIEVEERRLNEALGIGPART
jgi:3-dehydroquinate synthetase